MSVSSRETNDRRLAKPPGWTRFSLRGLFVVTLVVAAFLAGRISREDAFRPALAGPWTATLPAGAQQPTTLRHVKEDRWIVSSRAVVFNGRYIYRNGQLVIDQPSDSRMKGLVWKWDGKQLVLIAEPAGTPTGSSYLGTVLRRRRK